MPHRELQCAHRYVKINQLYVNPMPTRINKAVRHINYNQANMLFNFGIQN